MRFISELIEKKRSDSVPAVPGVGLPHAHGVARHGVPRSELSAVHNAAIAAIRQNGLPPTTEFEVETKPFDDEVPQDDAITDAAEKPEPLILRAEQMAEPPSETQQDRLHLSLDPADAPDEAVAASDEVDETPEAAAPEDEDTSVLASQNESPEAPLAPADSVPDKASDIEVDLDRAFESPLKAFPAEPDQPVVSDRPDDGLEEFVEEFAEYFDEETGEGTGRAEASEQNDASEIDAAKAESPKDETMSQISQTMRIWDLDREADDGADDAAPAPDPVVEPALEPLAAAVPAAETAPDAPADRPKSQRAGRVKTRLLGFHHPEEIDSNPFARKDTARTAQTDRFPVGWLIVVKGPGRGASYGLYDGVSTIGRGDDQAVALDHGDTSISRENHAAVAYDREQKSFFIGHGGKANLVRLNGMPVLSTEPLSDGNEIRIGETTLRFVALCGPDFSWDDDNEDGARDVATL